jgi:alcohol dehydrogenase class IV
VHAGPEALSLLPSEVDRTGASRALILCGRSVATKTELIALLAQLLGERLVGVFSSIGKDAPLSDVQAAADVARECKADILIAVGAGSVLKAARVVAILLGETGAVDTLVTQYPPNKPPFSPRLCAAKLPLINVLTAGTSAQNRGGAALKDSARGIRLEFFDPKTRPVAIFWDERALLTAPPSLAFTTGLSVYWRALMNMGSLSTANPLVEGSRRQAFLLATRAMPRLRDARDGAARIDVCAAALLQNRDEEDGGRPFDAHWIARVVYALVAATCSLVESVDQGCANALYTVPAIRRFGHLCPQVIENMCEALQIQGWNAPAASPQDCLIQHLSEMFAMMGVPDRLRDLGVGSDHIEEIVRLSLTNFNADRQRELSAYEETLGALVLEAW